MGPIISTFERTFIDLPSPALSPCASRIGGQDLDDEEFERQHGNENSTLRDIFEEFIEKEDVNNRPKKEVSEELKKLSEWVLRQIDRLLEMRKIMFFDNGYPYNRRFHREEFWEFARKKFSDRELEQGYNYDEVFDYLVEEEYLLFNERGSDPMFDVFEAVMV